MNRIVLIGNGFDKAHSLATGYGDFLDYLRDSICKYEKNQNGSYSLAGNAKKCGNQRGFYHKMKNQITGRI